MEFTIANALTIIDKYKAESAKKMGMTFNNLCNSCTNVEAIPKDQYENRLKADMVDMLTELQLEIESYKLSEDELSDMDEDSVKWGMKIAYDIVDKYKSESEEEDEQKDT